MVKDSVTAFERLAQISLNAHHERCVRIQGLGKKLFEHALKRQAKRMAASLVNPSQLTQVGFAVT